ncbi:YybH family protein [Limnoglobus roseus]|uniref:SnoaL-like domain-containing protein n=1 Tax=Limnoglobus roseus TaxID=2598579 RepID=A0A5C1ABH2_9BACT|nr:SgcJ/EcaC family oxidoreductase [Limnoglobus roseus]QEL14368.1 hypothetical protein PX52LOC_01256 [Limnoglobus roseus]
MTVESALTRDEAQIHRLLADQMSAICAKDLDRIMSFYAADAVTFDIKPPFQLKGNAALRQMWEQCLPCFPDGSLSPVTRDVRVVAGGDVAAIHWLSQFAGWPPGHPAAEMWMRGTAVYRKTGGEWKIVHDHVSVPFDPRTGQIVPKPEA